MLLSLVINGCGGSNRPATASTTAPAAQSSPYAATSPSRQTATAAPPATTTTTATTTTSSAAASPHTGTTGASNARLPASFVVTARGSLSPQSVSAPAGVTIALSVTSGDGRAHQVVVRTAPPVALAVTAGGRALRELRGLKAGRYAIAVDGAGAGTLIIGVQAGP